MFSADNLQFFLEVSRTQRIAEAARRLRVDQTTVSRRLSRLEKELGTRLFDRSATGWQLTEAGRELAPYAEAVETTVVAARNAAGGQRAPDGALSGTVRILAPDGLGSYLLLPAVGELRARHPDLMIEVLTATTRHLLTGRDFDVGVTLEEPSARSVEVEKLADYRLKLYASRHYLRRHGSPATIEALKSHTLVWYLDDVLDVEPLRILDAALPGMRVPIQTNNIAGHHQAALAGLGIVPLPSYIGDPDPQLVAVLDEKFAPLRSYWLVVPRELYRLARVAEVVCLLRALVDRNPELSSP